MTINIRGAPEGSADEYRRARQPRCSKTVAGLRWSAPNYGERNYYDELDGGGLGRGYLGLPRISDPDLDRLNPPFAGGQGVVALGFTGAPPSTEWCCTTPGKTSQTITFEEPMRLLRGHRIRT